MDMHWRHIPHIFSNGKFDIKVKGDINTYRHFTFINDKAIVIETDIFEVSIDHITLMARPVCDMSKKEWIDLLRFDSSGGYESEKDAEDSFEIDKDYLLGLYSSGNCSFNDAMFLTGRGVYPLNHREAKQVQFVKNISGGHF